MRNSPAEDLADGPWNEPERRLRRTPIVHFLGWVSRRRTVWLLSRHSALPPRRSAGSKKTARISRENFYRWPGPCFKSSDRLHRNRKRKFRKAVYEKESASDPNI